MSFPVIDAHQHVWDPARADYGWLVGQSEKINRVVELEELLPELRTAGVDRVVQVQSADDIDDTVLMRESASKHPEVAAIVGYVPLERPEEAAEIAESWRGDSLMVGVRNLIHDRPDPDFLLRPDVDEGLGVLEREGLAFDLVAVLPRHLELVPILAERHPELRIVIDHLGKPPIGGGDDRTWRELISAAGRYPNVFGKVSGLYAAVGDQGSWTTETIAPFFEHAVGVFGARRLMYGGDWPMSLLAGGYTRVWEGLAPLFATLSAAEREAVLGRTAAEFYRIDPARL